MPAFYLLALAIAATAGLFTWLNSPGRPAGAYEGARAVGEPSPASRPAEVVKAAAVDVGEPADAILRTPEGLRRKVLVKDLDALCWDGPAGGRSVGPPLEYFGIWYLYGESPPGADRRVRIGPREGAPRGWVATRSVLEWDTRLMARPTPRGGRPRLVIYADQRCLLDSLAGRTCPLHRGACPTEGEEGPAESPGTALGMPILRSRSTPQHDGTTRTIFEVASLVRDVAPPAPPPAAPPADFLPSLRRVDVAFAIDTTASMKATIVAARQLAERLVADASRRHRDVVLRLGLVDYRDDWPNFGFKTRIVTRFTDPASFLAALGTIEAARHGDGSVEEAVFDGVAAALPGGPAEPAGSHLNWPTGRPGDLTTKMLVLLGDAPDHDRDLDRANSLAALAERSGITIAVVALDRPGSLSREERARYVAQWRTLAQGSFRPLDPSTGFTRRVPPILLRPEQADRLVPMLEAIIADRIEHARNLAALAAAEAEGRLGEYVNGQGLTLDRVAPVLVDLHRGESAGQARPDPRSQGRKAPSIRLGWIAAASGGAPLVTVEVLMSRAELGVLIDELTQLQLAAQGTATDLADLLRIGNAAAAGESGFLAADRGSQTFADHLRRRQGLPPARPDSLLRRTQADLLQADDLYRAALDSRLGSCLGELVRRRNAPDWDDPRRTIDGMALVPYALFDF